LCSMDPASNPPSSALPTPISATPPRSYEAAHAVLNTNELICEIIGRLPLEDIVVTTGVCRTWRNVLKGNKSIQRALFLVPADIQEITTSTECLSMRVEDIPREQYAIVAEPNPYTARICGQMHALIEGPTTWEEECRREDAPLQKFEHPHGTWRNMFVTQPPVEILYVSCYAGGQAFSRRFECEEGVTLGKLHRFIELNLRAYRRPSVVISFTPRGFFPERSLSVRGPYNRWWEVRNGRVHRRIQPPNNMIDITGDITDTDDDQMPVSPQPESSDDGDDDGDDYEE
jgi:hypothetical protein